MPNWCFNELTLIGEQMYLQKFNCENLNNEGDIDFGRSVPFPRNRDEDKEWYEWRIENWGTKWTASDTLIKPKFEKDTVIYEFCTAWAPPIEWLTKVSGIYPDVKFELKYHEPNEDFSGIYEIKDDDIIKQVDGIYGEFFGEPIENLYDSDSDSDSDNDNDTSNTIN